MRIIESKYLMKSVHRETERSRKRRAKKPWAKMKFVIVSYPDPDFYVTPHGVICHPMTARRIRDEIARRGMLS